jgi:hypothetical protein
MQKRRSQCWPRDLARSHAIYLLTMSRTRLLQLAAQLDRLLAEADSILAAPVYADIGVLAEELRELVVDIQAKVDEKLNDQP